MQRGVRFSVTSWERSHELPSGQLPFESNFLQIDTLETSWIYRQLGPLRQRPTSMLVFTLGFLPHRQREVVEEIGESGSFEENNTVPGEGLALFIDLLNSADKPKQC